MPVAGELYGDILLPEDKPAVGAFLRLALVPVERQAALQAPEALAVVFSTGRRKRKPVRLIVPTKERFLRVVLLGVSGTVAPSYLSVAVGRLPPHVI